MTLAIAWPIAFAIVGALVYGLSANGKVAELGRVTFSCGMLWLVYVLLGHVLRF